MLILSFLEEKKNLQLFFYQYVVYNAGLWTYVTTSHSAEGVSIHIEADPFAVETSKNVPASDHDNFVTAACCLGS